MKTKTKVRQKTTTRTTKRKPKIVISKYSLGNKRDEKFNEIIRVLFSILDIAIFLLKRYTKDENMQHLVDLRYTLKKLIDEIEALIRR